jgi:hypothetical protein
MSYGKQINPRCMARANSAGPNTRTAHIPSRARHFSLNVIRRIEIILAPAANTLQLIVLFALLITSNALAQDGDSRFSRCSDTTEFVELTITVLSFPGGNTGPARLLWIVDLQQRQVAALCRECADKCGPAHLRSDAGGKVRLQNRHALFPHQVQ